MANYNKDDGFTFYFFRVNETEEAVLGANFDAQVNYDLDQLKKEAKERSTLKKMCVIKLILFPFQYPLTLMLLGKIMAADTLKTSKLYVRFLRNKIDMKSFKTELNVTVKQLKVRMS